MMLSRNTKKYSVENQNAPHFMTKVIKLKPFPFKKITLDYIMLAGQNTVYSEVIAKNA